MANNKLYVSLPTPAPTVQHQRSGSRRPPLTPSTVSSPCLSPHTSIATRRDSGSSSPTKASSILARVGASNPATSKSQTPTSSPITTPTSRNVEMHSSPMYTPERPQVWRSESAKYVRQYRHQDGYISFPDYEKFCQTQSPYDNQRREHTAVQT